MGTRLGVRLAYPASPNPLLALCTAHELARAEAVGVVPCVQEQPSQPDRSSNRRAVGGWRFAPSTADERMTTGSSVRVIADFPRVFSFQRMFALTCARARAESFDVRTRLSRRKRSMGPCPMSSRRVPRTPCALSCDFFVRRAPRAVARAKSDARARARDQPGGSAIRWIALGSSPSQEQVRGPLKGFWRRSRMSSL